MLRRIQSHSTIASQSINMPVYHHADYTLVLPDAHTFPMARYNLVHQGLRKKAKKCGIEIRSPIPSTKEQVSLAHDVEYINKFTTGQLDAMEVRTLGFPWSYDLVRRTYRITGATVQCIHNVCSDGYDVAGNLAGGTHHAFAAHAEGYCIFNDVAVAARVAQEEYQVGKCLVIDLDVHQGNGTAEIFTNDETVFTWSVHGDKNYPWKSRVASNLDTPLPDDVTGDEYLDEVEKGLTYLENNVQDYDIVFYQAGVDPLSYDRLGRLNLTREDLQSRNALVYSWCEAHNKKCVVTMGGGYSRPIEKSVACHIDVFEQASKILGQKREPSPCLSRRRG
jgi:acetoin utilization deacetylase AcuC-like enzyme